MLDRPIRLKRFPGGVTRDTAKAECCAECGATGPGLVDLGGAPVCSACAPRALENLREGIRPGMGSSSGPWREDGHLVVAINGPMPPSCVKCGKPPIKHLRKRLTWHHPALYLLLLLNPVLYVIVALIVERKATFHIPVCARCNARRVRNAAIGYGSLFTSIGLVSAAFVLVEKHADLTDIVCLAGLALFLFSVIWLAGMPFMPAKRMTAHFVWIANADPEAVAALPVLPPSIHASE